MSKAITIAARQRKAIQRAYRRLGNWRAVAGEFGGINVSYVYNFAVHGVEPVNQEARYRLGLDARPKPDWLKAGVKFLANREIPQAAEAKGEIRLYVRGGKRYVPR